MAITIKSNRITDDIVDENGELITTISYNPEDTRAYARLSDIIQKIYKIQDKIKENTPYIKELPKKNLSLEELEEYRDSLEKVNETLNFQETIMDEIFKDFDYVFGDQTCEKIMGNSQDIIALMPIIEAVKPNFEKSRRNKFDKYLLEKNIETLDVME